MVGPAGLRKGPAGKKQEGKATRRKERGPTKKQKHGFRVGSGESGAYTQNSALLNLNEEDTFAHK